VDIPAGSGRRGAAVPSTDIACTEPDATTLIMDHRDDARAEELNNLRLALATFALQLDAFEMRTNGGALRAGTKPGVAAPPPAIGCRLQKEEMIGGQ